MENVLINITAEPIKVNHISWFTVKDNIKDEIELFEVIELFYPHPDAPEHATIQQLDTRFVKKVSRLRLRDACNLILLEAALEAISKEEDKNGK